MARLAVNFFHKRFSTGDVVRAAGVTNDQLQSWLRRDFIVGHKGTDVEKTGSPGKYRTYVFYSVMEIAIAKALTDAGVPVAQAFAAAAHFAHTGGTHRNPGMPFYDGSYTLLCVSGGQSSIIRHSKDKDLLAEIRTKLVRPEVCTIVNTNPIFDRVVSSLGFHPEAIMEMAKGDSPAPEGEAEDWDHGEIIND